MPISPDSPVVTDAPKTIHETKPFFPWVWWPLGVLALGFMGEFASAFIPGVFRTGAFYASLALIVGATLYFIVQCLGRLLLRQWNPAGVALLRLIFLIPAGFFVFCMGAFFHAFGPSEDHFADNLKIPEGIEISEPVPDAAETGPNGSAVAQEKDDFQSAVRAALSVAGGADSSFTPAMPSLRQAATNHPDEFRAYIEASPDWHVFMEQGHRFAARRWSYGGEPRDTLHGYISEFGGEKGFQTRCLLCLDRQQWSRYTVQHTPEGTTPVKPEMSVGNRLQESRVMIECGGVWVEIFEQSGQPERRITKATVVELEKEFAAFSRDRAGAVAMAKERSRQLALRLAGGDPAKELFRLLIGMQPGIYGVAYALNTGAPGVVYLKAFEITQGTPLSESPLRHASETRMTWSKDPAERFGAKTGFTIYEGDRGKPYAARFEVWFKPDDGSPERKLAERVFKIEGWQR